MKRSIIILSVLFSFVLTGCSLPWKQSVTEQPAPQVKEVKQSQFVMKITTKEGKTYDYFIEPQEGMTAFDLFKHAGVPVGAKQYDFGVYVQAVGGVKEGDGLFWIYYLNGTPAMQAADKYQVKKGDVIEWKLEKEKKGL